MRYGQGALVSATLFTGALLILSGSGIIPLNPQTLIGAILAVLGLYTAVFGAISREKGFYIPWGAILLVIGLAFMAPSLVNPLIGLGLIMLFIGVFAFTVSVMRRA